MTTETIPFFLQHVTAQLGEAEHPLGSNNTKFGVQFGWNDVSWCAEFGWDMYADCGVALPVKTAACVVIWDAAVKAGLAYSSVNCVPGDSLIRTWQHLDRAHLNPALTHYQIVDGIHLVNGVKYLDLIGGNQGPGVVSRDTVPAGDPSILGGMAFHRLFSTPVSPAPHDPSTDHASLPAAKSHKYPTAFVSLGSHGPLVVAVQAHLQVHGFYVHQQVDGIFGRGTLAAVIAFQKASHLAVDGVVGPATYRALGF